MTSRNKQLLTWISMGLCRTTTIARELGFSRQYVDKLSKMSAGISQEQWGRFQLAIEIIESDEADSPKHIEQNILRSARLCHNSDDWVACNAKSNLDKWVMILASHEGQ